MFRALEDLVAQERTMRELDNHKDQIMMVRKLALANLAMWTRDQRFPAFSSQLRGDFFQDKMKPYSPYSNQEQVYLDKNLLL